MARWALLREITVDPILLKELGGMSRRVRTYFARFFYVVLTGVVLYAVIAPILEGRGGVQPSEYAYLSRRLFTSFNWVQMLFLPLAAAVSASDMIHAEARRGTLGILMTTPLSIGGIVFGKFKAVMAYTVSLAMCGMPVLAITVYLSGVGVEDLAWSVSLALAQAAVVSAISIYYSITQRTVVEAALRAYFVLHGSAVLLLFLGIIGRDGLFLGAWIHPDFAWAAAANPAESGAASFGWIGAVLVSLWITWMFLRSSAGHLRSGKIGGKLVEGPAGATPTPVEQGFAARKPGPVWDRWPLFWKEYSTRPVRMPLGYGLVMLGLLSFLTFVSFMGGPAGSMVQLFVISGMALVFAVAVGAGHFAREKERRGFEMLLSTPLTPSHVVATKLLSGLLTPESVALMMFIGVGFVGLTHGRDVPSLRSVTREPVPPVSALTTVLFLAFSYVTASAASLRAGTYRAAFIASAGVVLFVLVGIPILTNLLEGTALGDSDSIRFLSRALHPIRANLAEPTDPGYLMIVPFNLAFYTAATAAMIGGMILRFRTRVQGG